MARIGGLGGGRTEDKQSLVAICIQIQAERDSESNADLFGSVLLLMSLCSGQCDRYLLVISKNQSITIC